MDTAKYGVAREYIPLGPKNRDVGEVGQTVLDESALPDAGLADDVEDATVSRPRFVEGAPEFGQLGLASDEWQLLGGSGVGAVLVAIALLSDQRRADRFGLPLDQEGLQVVELEFRRDEFEHCVARDDLSRRRLLHEAGRQIDGVAHDSERAPPGRAEIAHVDRTTVEADPYRQPDVHRDQFARGPDRSILVLPGGSWCPGGENDLAAARVHVARQPEHAVASGGLFGCGRKCLQSLVHGIGADRLQQRIDAAEEHEPDRHRAVLRDDAGRGLLDQPVG